MREEEGGREEEEEEAEVRRAGLMVTLAVGGQLQPGTCTITRKHTHTHAHLGSPPPPTAAPNTQKDPWRGSD